MDGLPDGGNSALNTNQVSCEVESLLDGFNLIVGSCAFIYLADTAAGINEKIGERICEPFFTLKTDSGKSLGLPIVYRIIKAPNGYARGGNQWRQGEVNIYLPLTKQEIVDMMSIPLGESCGR